MFFYKMKGDDHRHFAESNTGDADSEVAVDAPVAYDEDTKTARKDLVVIHPIRLSLILNFSGSQLDVIQNPEEACKMSRVASEDLFAKASRTSYRDEGTPKESEKKSDFEAEDAKHSAKLEAAVDGENLTLQLDQSAVSKRQLQMDTTCAHKQVCRKEYVESVEEVCDDESNDAEERISAVAKLGKLGKDIWQPCDISQSTAECLLMVFPSKRKLVTRRDELWPVQGGAEDTGERVMTSYTELCEGCEVTSVEEHGCPELLGSIQEEGEEHSEGDEQQLDRHVNMPEFHLIASHFARRPNLLTAWLSDLCRRVDSYASRMTETDCAVNAKRKEISALKDVSSAISPSLNELRRELGESQHQDRVVPLLWSVALVMAFEEVEAMRKDILCRIEKCRAEVLDVVSQLRKTTTLLSEDIVHCRVETNAINECLEFMKRELANGLKDCESSPDTAPPAQYDELALKATEMRLDAEVEQEHARTREHEH